MTWITFFYCQQWWNTKIIDQISFHNYFLESKLKTFFPFSQAHYNMTKCKSKVDFDFGCHSVRRLHTQLLLISSSLNTKAYSIFIFSLYIKKGTRVTTNKQKWCTLYMYERETKWEKKIEQKFPRKEKASFIFDHKIGELIKQTIIIFMMVVDLEAMGVVEMIGHTFDKLVDTLMVEDMMSFDYKIHYKDYL